MKSVESVPAKVDPDRRSGACPIGLSRRSVVKSTAWAVPVIASMAWVPAAVASGGSAQIVFDTARATAQWDDSGRRAGLAVGLQVRNVYTPARAEVRVVLVQVTVADSDFPVTTSPQLTQVGNHWSYAGATSSNHRTSFNFVYSGLMESSPSENTSELDVVLVAQGHNLSFPQLVDFLATSPEAENAPTASVTVQ